MKQKLKVELSEELSYWIGVSQSDGCLTRYTKRDKIRSELGIAVCSKSLPMLERFRDISFKIFGRHSYIWETKGRDEWRFHIGVKELLPLFKKLGIILSPLFIPPVWVVTEPKYFGAYLAGLVDGDGDIRIKRSEYPQCRIRLCSGLFQDILQKQIEFTLKSKVSQYKRHRTKFFESFGRVISGSWVEIEFGITRGSYQFIQKYVVPYMTLPHKKERVSTFITKNYAPVGI